MIACNHIKNVMVIAVGYFVCYDTDRFIDKIGSHGSKVASKQFGQMKLLTHLTLEITLLAML